MMWLGGALAAGAVTVATYLLPGTGLDKAFAQDIAYFRIGAGAPGSTLYDLAGQIASAISNPPGSRQCDNDGPCGVEGVIGLAQTATDPVSALQSVDGGLVESAIVSADIADAAVQGTGPFKKSGPMTELRAIANVGQLVLHVLVAKEARFADLSALNGKRIAIGVKDSDNAVTARALLRAAGINEKKTKLMTGDPEAAALDLLGDKVDALVLVAQLPNADVASLMRTGNYKLLSAKPCRRQQERLCRHRLDQAQAIFRNRRRRDLVGAGRLGGALLALGRARRRPCQGGPARRQERRQDPPEPRSNDRSDPPRRRSRPCRTRQGRRKSKRRRLSRSRTRRTSFAPSRSGSRTRHRLPCCPAAGGRSSRRNA